MSLSQARTYLKQQIALVDDQLKEWRDSFNIENIPQTNIDNYYHINIESVSTTQQDNWIEDDMSATVTIFKRGFSEPVTAFDSVIDIANCIRLKVLDPKASLTDNITSVEVNSVTPEQVDESNDNTIKESIDFSIRLTFYT